MIGEEEALEPGVLVAGPSDSRTEGVGVGDGVAAPMGSGGGVGWQAVGVRGEGEPQPQGWEHGCMGAWVVRVGGGVRRGRGRGNGDRGRTEVMRLVAENRDQCPKDSLEPTGARGKWGRKENRG